MQIEFGIGPRVPTNWSSGEGWPEGKLVLFPKFLGLRSIINNGFSLVLVAVFRPLDLLYPQIPLVVDLPVGEQEDHAHRSWRLVISAIE